MAEKNTFVTFPPYPHNCHIKLYDLYHRPYSLNLHLFFLVCVVHKVGKDCKSSNNSLFIDIYGVAKVTAFLFIQFIIQKIAQK